MKPKAIEPEDIKKIRDFHAKRGRMPSYAELARLFRYASKQAAYRLADKMINAGILERDKAGKLVPQMGGEMPLLGSIQAGFPNPAEDDLLDTINLDQYLVRRPAASFLLKVSGDSMIEAGILPGDVVVVERGRPPQNGDIVVAHIDREWTLKYYFKYGPQPVLKPANSKYPVLRPKEELQIAGIVVSALRKYK